MKKILFISVFLLSAIVSFGQQWADLAIRPPAVDSADFKGYNLRFDSAGVLTYAILLRMEGNATDDSIKLVYRLTAKDSTSYLDSIIVPAVDIIGGGAGGGDPDQSLSFTSPNLTISGTGGNTVNLSALDTDTQLTNEQVEDISGNMFAANTETRITTSYNDATGKVDITVDADLSNYSNATTGFITAVADDPTPTLSNTLDANNNNLIDVSDILFNNGAGSGTIQTGTGGGNNFQLRAYDVDDGIFRTLIEADAGNDVRLQLFADYLDLEDGADPTKIIQFDVSGLTTATTRLVGFPDKSGTIAFTDDLIPDDQTLNFVSPNLSIADGNTVDISAINTDGQTLSFANPNLSITGGNSVNISAINTDDQTIAVDSTGAGTGSFRKIRLNMESANQIVFNDYGSDGVATGGTYDAINNEFDFTVAAPGSNFSVDASALVEDTDLLDNDATNEGSLTVGAGTGSTSLISSNTSGSTDVTIEAGSGLTISELANTITLAAVDVSATNEIQTLTIDSTASDGTFRKFTATLSNGGGSIVWRDSTGSGGGGGGAFTEGGTFAYRSDTAVVGTTTNNGLAALQVTGDNISLDGVNFIQRGSIAFSESLTIGGGGQDAATPAAAASNTTIIGNIRTANQFDQNDDDNVIIGGYAGWWNSTLSSTQNRNVIIGSRAASGALKNGVNDNVLIGYHAGRNITGGDRNVGIGADALYSVTTGFNNVGIGDAALRGITIGDHNVAISEQALNDVGFGSYNIGIGYQALDVIDDDLYNIGFGFASLGNLTEGDNNIAIGRETGAYAGTIPTTLTTANHGIFIGYRSRPGANISDNEIAIGREVEGRGSNTATIGNPLYLDSLFTFGVEINEDYTGTTNQANSATGKSFIMRDTSNGVSHNVPVDSVFTESYFQGYIATNSSPADTVGFDVLDSLTVEANNVLSQDAATGEITGISGGKTYNIEYWTKVDISTGTPYSVKIRFQYFNGSTWSAIARTESEITPYYNISGTIEGYYKTRSKVWNAPSNATKIRVVYKCDDAIGTDTITARILEDKSSISISQL